MSLVPYLCFSSFFLLFFFYSSVDHRDLHSFPTRRSSDLPDDEHARQRRALLHDNLMADAVANVVQRNAVSDRKSTRLNSSHLGISYAVFCLKKKNKSECHHPTYIYVLPDRYMPVNQSNDT